MKLLFQKQIVTFEQTPIIEEVIEKINELLQDQFYFSHLLVDGDEILEDPEQFLVKHLADLDSLEVIAVAAKEFVNDLLLSAEEYTERSVPQITELVDEFYNNPSGENWADLSALFEGVQWLTTMIETVNQSAARPTTWDKVVTSSEALQNELGNLEEALENADTVLVADMLQYEMLPVFESFVTEFKTTIDAEGTRHDLS